MYDVTAVPPTVTAVAPVNPVPVIVIVEPDIALVGVNDEMVGGGAKPITESPIANFLSDSVPV